MSSPADPTASGPLPALRAALRGQYDIQRELGRGGMGIVLLARDERLDRQVALKVLPPELADSPDTRERFLREARMAAQLSHPNIVPVFRADELGGFAFFAMGYVDGETMGERIRDRGTLPAAEVVRILRETAWALAYAHARGIVHRDVKPDNILLERASGRAFVSDFGIARAEFNPALTQDGLVLGSVHFMSPEQASGEALDGRSDLYALGCIGFLALSGRLPFDSTSPQAILLAHATKEPPSLRSVAPSVPAALAAVIDRCLRKRASERYATGEELADALGKALQVVEQESREAGGAAVLSGDDAMAVWRRAAELQAEAASRLEARMREQQTRALPAAGDGLVAAGASSNGASSAVPTDAYRLRDVEAAAVEAGISQRYVALALDEMRSKSPSDLATSDVSPFAERLGTRLFGTIQRTVSVSRVFRAAPRVVLSSLGRSLQASPWMLSLKDTLGGHPLDGGVLVFGIPDMVGANYKWTMTRYGTYVPEIRVTLTAVPGDSHACEVTMTIDLRRGLKAVLWAYGFLSGVGTAGAGVVGAVIGKAALALSGAALASSALAGAGLAGLGILLSAGSSYRSGIRAVTREMHEALGAIDASMRAFDIFGEAPPPLPPPQPASDGMSF